MNKLMSVFEPLPQPARRSITFDRGFEFREWRKLQVGIGTESWFCDPQAPWQKGSVENLNKRARRHLPRNTQLAALSNRDDETEIAEPFATALEPSQCNADLSELQTLST